MAQCKDCKVITENKLWEERMGGWVTLRRTRGICVKKEEKIVLLLLLQLLLYYYYCYYYYYYGKNVEHDTNVYVYKIPQS
jgi:hypothetical protein